MKASRVVIPLNGVPFLEMRSVVSHNTSGREKEEKEKDIVECFSIRPDVHGTMICGKKNL